MPSLCSFRPARIWIRFLLVLASLVSAVASGPSWAIDATGHQWSTPGGTYVSGSASGVCQAVLAAQIASGAVNPAAVFDSVNMNGVGTVGDCVLTAPGQHYIYSSAVMLDSCSAGYTLQSDGTCKSNTPPPQNCADPSLMNKYKGAGYTTASTQAGAPDYICIKGCQYDPGGVTVTYPNPNSVTGYTSGGRAGASSGKSCDMQNWPQITLDVDLSNATDPKKLPPSPEVCAAQGKFFGQVNGADVCSPAVPPGGSVSTNDGTTTSQTGGTGSGSPGADPDTSTSKTTCDGQNCTTTTVVVGGGGRTVNCGSVHVAGASIPAASGPATNDTCTTTVTVPQQKFCEQNPNASMCKDDSAGGGSDCSAPPSCSGDAISCAILAQQWNTRCELQKANDFSDYGVKLVNGQDPMAGQLPTPDKAVQVDMSQRLANVDDMGFTAQCLPDLNIPLALPGGGTTLHIDTTPLCNFGKLLGYLNMLSTLMLCAYMLKGSF